MNTAFFCERCISAPFISISYSACLSIAAMSRLQGKNTCWINTCRFAGIQPAKDVESLYVNPVQMEWSYHTEAAICVYLILFAFTVPSVASFIEILEETRLSKASLLVHAYGNYESI